MRRLFQHHPVYGYKFIPNLRARVPADGGGYRVQTNAQGFRSGRPYVPARPQGRRRILVFGDSFTAADGVRNEDRYTDVLESMLPDTEVLNFAMPGTGTDQQYLIFREEAASFEADLLVIAVLVENIRRIVARYRPYLDDGGTTVFFAKPYFVLDEGGALRLCGTPVPPEPVPPELVPEEDRQYLDQGGRFGALRRIANAVGAREILQKVTSYQPVPEFDDPGHPAWRLMKAILQRWIGEARVPVILFPIPLYQHVEETAAATGYRARFAELDDPPGVTVCDPLPALHRHDPAARRAFRFPRDIHPTPAAHRVLAETLARTIREMGLPRTA